MTTASVTKSSALSGQRAIGQRQAIRLLDAVEQAPTLARLVASARASQACLQSAIELLPSAMHPAVAAGSLDNGQWCIMAGNSAVAAKLRHLSPSLLAHLRSRGHAVELIRIKVMVSP